MKKRKPIVMWFIVGTYGFYIGGSFTRKNAIEQHCRELWQTWEYCKKKGDRVIKCKVTPL